MRSTRQDRLRHAAALGFLLLASVPAAGAGLAEVKRAQRLVVAAPASDLPFEADVLRGFAKALGVELRVDPQAGLGGSLQALLEGRADVAAGGLVSQRDRRDGVSYSNEVFPTRFMAVNRAPAAAPTFIEALRNASRILAPAATGAAEVAQAAKLPSFKTDATLSADKALAALRADAGNVALLGLFDALVARRADPALQIGVAIGPRQSVAFAVRQADADLLAALNAQVGQLRSSPAYRLVVGRALGDDAVTLLARAHVEDAQ